MHAYDVVSIGRSGLDLYAEQVGVPFEEIQSFAAYVGGTPANIAVGARRLGLRCAILSAVSEDPVGDFILHFLTEQGIDARFVSRKRGHRSGAVLLGMQPPDLFPIVHYRTNCADLQLNVDDVERLPMGTIRTLVIVGTNLTAEPSRTATLYAAEKARRYGADVVLDLDYRSDQWPEAAAFGIAARVAARLADVVIGTREEITAAARSDDGVAEILDLGPAALVEKCGPDGSRVYLQDGAIVDAPGFAVNVQNVLGAGDAFAAGFLYGRLGERSWRESARLGNACGAIVVTRHGCSASCPTLDELHIFIDEHGGL